MHEPLRERDTYRTGDNSDSVEITSEETISLVLAECYAIALDRAREIDTQLRAVDVVAQSVGHPADQ